MQNLSCVNEFYLQKNKKSFLFHWPRTSPRFEKEVLDNSEMALGLLKVALLTADSYHIVKTCGKRKKQI